MASTTVSAKGLADTADGGAMGAFLDVPGLFDMERSGLVCPSQLQGLVACSLFTLDSGRFSKSAS